MSKKTKKTLDDILENAIATDFEGDLPGDDCKPDFNSLPKLDRELYNLDRNDYENGYRLFKRYGKDLMYLYNAGWCAWNDKYWSIKDGKYLARRYAGETAKAIKGEVTALWVEGRRADEDEENFKKRLKSFHKFSVSCGNYSRQKAMLENAQVHLLTDEDDLDRRPFLFNLKNGTLNLNATPEEAEECGDIESPCVALGKHDREHKITKISDIDYQPGAEAEKFKKFLSQIMPDDEVRLFLQRFFGYALTGHVKEQVLVMLQGGGSNGKSTLIKIIQNVLGDYAMTTPFATLVRNDNQKGSDASPDIARLPSSRLVVASEPKKGIELDDGTVKMLIGDDKNPVRNIYQGFFEFVPTFKICVACNNKPRIRATDDGIWRRILLVEFTQKFVPKDILDDHPGAHVIDQDLEEKLKEEYPGILNWLIEGYRMWKDTGLKVPDKIRAATAKYRSESNKVYLFFVECCKRSPGAKIQASRLHSAYKIWCKREGEKYPLARNSFGTEFANLGIQKEEKQYNYWLDIQLTDEAEQALLDEERSSWGAPSY